jgi:SMC interacting uncharacterized protein involved in chromosome segregation
MDSLKSIIEGLEGAQGASQLMEICNKFVNSDMQKEVLEAFATAMFQDVPRQAEPRGTPQETPVEPRQPPITSSQVIEYIKTLESKETSWKGVVKQIQLENQELRNKLTNLESKCSCEKDETLKALQQENEKLRHALEVLMARL